MPSCLGACEEEALNTATRTIETALSIDPQYTLACRCGLVHAQRFSYNWADDIAESQALAGSLAAGAAEMRGNRFLIILPVSARGINFDSTHGNARVAALERRTYARIQCRMGWSRIRMAMRTMRIALKGHRNFERSLRL